MGYYAPAYQPQPQYDTQDQPQYRPRYQPEYRPEYRPRYRPEYRPGYQPEYQQAPQDQTGAPRMMDQSVPAVARSACLARVAQTANTRNVRVTEMVYSEANSQVTVGVGPQAAPWRCLVSNSGVVAEVMSLTNEGGL